jgi:hypothetical protein
MLHDEPTPRDSLEAIAEEVVDIARTWVETGFSIALGALGAAADALRSTGDHLARMSQEVLPDDAPYDEVEIEADDEVEAEGPS